MDMTVDNDLLARLQPEAMVDFLRLEQWQEVETSRSGWRLFISYPPGVDEPIEIVVPSRATSSEARVHLASAVNLLSALHDETPDTTIQRINYRNDDILQIVNTNPLENSSIPLSTAMQQLHSMYTLVGAGILAEKEVRPAFRRIERRIINKEMNSYRFGHTFVGSFGYTISAQIHSPTVMPVTQRRLFAEYDDTPLIIASPARRVMERIVRGLLYTQEAVETQRPELLASRYTTGFVANMCRAVVDMTDDRSQSIIYRILWSPRERPSEDLINTTQIQMPSLAYSTLETAEMQLKETKPEQRKIVGYVSGLFTRGNPSLANAQRTIALQWTEKDIPGSRTVFVELTKDDYQRALHAHEDILTVEVIGLLQPFGSYWRLRSPTEFRVRQ